MLKILDSTYKGPRKKRKIIFLKQITTVNFVQYCPTVRLFHNSDQNEMTIFLHENLKIAYIEVQETNGKFLLKKKKNSVKFRTRMPQGLTV